MLPKPLTLLFLLTNQTTMKNALFILSAAILLTSCGGSGFLTRKYTKGIYSESISKASKPQSHSYSKTNNRKGNAEQKSNPDVIYSTTPAQTISSPSYAENSVVTKKMPFKKHKATQTVKTHKEISLPALTKNTHKKTESSKSQGRKDDNFIIMVILCFFPFINLIPVYMHDGKKVTLNFWITLLLNLLIFGGVIFALLVVFDIISLA